MRALRLTALAAPLLCILAACGSSSDDNPPAAAPTTPGSATSTAASAPIGDPSVVVPPTDPALPPPTVTGPPPPPGATVLPKNQVESRSLPQGSEVYVGDDGRTITLTVMARDACSGVEATVTEETADTVKILLSPMLQPQGGPPYQACAQVLTPRQVTVTLKEPLGNRRLLISESY